MFVVLAWLLVPFVLSTATGRFFGGFEYALWLVIGGVGVAALWARSRKLRQG